MIDYYNVNKDLFNLYLDFKVGFNFVPLRHF